MNNNDGDVTLEGKISVRYTPEVDGVAADIELSLNLLITGNLKGKPDNTPLDERTVIAINRYNLNTAISEAGIEWEFVVPIELNDAPNEQIYVGLKVKPMDDLSPDHIANQVPKIGRLLELCEVLVAFKSPLGNAPTFRTQLQALLENEDTHERLIQELGIAIQKQFSRKGIQYVNKGRNCSRQRVSNRRAPVSA